MKIRFTIAEDYCDPMTDEDKRIYVEVDWASVPRKGDKVFLTDNERQILSERIFKYMPIEKRVEEDDDYYSAQGLSDYMVVDWPIIYDYDEETQERHILIVLSN